MLTEDGKRMVTLVSHDKREFELTVNAATCAKLVRRSLGGDDDDDDDENLPEKLEPVEIMRVGGNALEKVVEFMKHHVEEPMESIPVPLGGETFDEVRRQ
jgi:hypothetical protein